MSDSIMTSRREALAAALDRVFYRTSELTVDARDMSQEDREIWLAEAKVRGLNVSGTSKWMLIRKLTP